MSQPQGMTPDEAAALVAFIAELRPGQPFGDNAGEAWHFVLDDVPLDLAKDAVRNIIRSGVQAEDGKRRGPRFIEPDDVFAEVKKIRRRHIETAGALPAPPPDASAVEQQQHLRSLLAGIGRGGKLRPPDLDPEVVAAIEARKQPKAIGGPAHETPVIHKRSGEVYDEIHEKAGQQAAAKPAGREPDPAMEAARRSITAFAAGIPDGPTLIQQFMETAAAELPGASPRETMLRVADLCAEHERTYHPDGYD